MSHTRNHETVDILWGHSTNELVATTYVYILSVYILTELIASQFLCCKSVRVYPTPTPTPPHPSMQSFTRCQVRLGSC